jgi:DNA-binding response OmpR family regulator
VTARARVLVVEDEPDLAMGLRVNLEVEGYEVMVAHTVAETVARGLKWDADLVLLDLMLPDGDGYEVLARLRSASVTVPVIVLTARGLEVDKVHGFRLGADDYVTKPFGLMELLMRIEAVLRRARHPRASDGAGPGTSTRVPLGVLQLDPVERTLHHGARAVTLTPRAVELLAALARRPGRVVSRHELLRDVWGYDASVTTRTVDAHVAELRRKLAQLGVDPELIGTVWKTGYRLDM